MRIGFDIGNVICESDTDYLTKGDLTAAREIPGAFDAIATCVKREGAENIFLVSKCGQRVQDLTWLWLIANDFFASTGVIEARGDHVRFCLKRGEKSGIATELGLDAFVDDRLQIVGSLPNSVKTRLLFQPRPAEVQPRVHLLPRVTVVSNWTEVMSALYP